MKRHLVFRGASLVIVALATLFVLPSAFAILAGGNVRSPSLDPDDPQSGFFESRIVETGQP